MLKTSYLELLNFVMEVTNIPKMKAYELTYEEKVHIIKKRLDRESLQLINILNIS